MSWLRAPSSRELTGRNLKRPHTSRKLYTDVKHELICNFASTNFSCFWHMPKCESRPDRNAHDQKNAAINVWRPPHRPSVRLQYLVAAQSLLHHALIHSMWAQTAIPLEPSPPQSHASWGAIYVWKIVSHMVMSSVYCHIQVPRTDGRLETL